MLTVASVLRSGGRYEPVDVLRLRAGVAENLSLPHRFLCFTDTDIPTVECVPLRHDWPRWWPKLEYFRRDVIDGPAMALDLDSLVVGKLDSLAALRVDFAGLSDFYDVHLSRPVVKFQTGVMVWTPGPHVWRIYEDMAADDSFIRRTPELGDHVWVGKYAAGAQRIQTLLPGQTVSYKIHCRNRPPQPSARLVCLHGRPGFRDMPVTNWARMRWEGLA